MKGISAHRALTRGVDPAVFLGSFYCLLRAEGHRFGFRRMQVFDGSWRATGVSAEPNAQ